MARAEAIRKPGGDAPLVRELITPEGVDLRLQLGDAGQRASAFLLDGAFIVLALIVMTIAAIGAAIASGFKEAGAEVALIVWLLGAFLLRNAYFLAFELTPRAATPGKRIMGLRVAARDGGRLTADAVFARNALRELEVFLPMSVLAAQAQSGDVEGWMWLLALIWSCIFVFMPLFNRDRLRCGDLVGGTWVVRTPKRKLEQDLADDALLRLKRFAFSPAQLDAYGVKELHVLEDVLRVRHRATMAEVAGRIRRKIAWVAAPAEDDEDFLNAYYAALRGRLEARLLMGKRRADKHDKS
ncbi:RDD family protein [Caulobacter sp. 17J80-11]|uniref:RDD family protein n=1 Tax=Caulobacter sp. 17J80-11 TaxID=2763502 RepID=UPI0016537021|nr:RDD family protein [Caulobacter sp. 17J80-11]MBC6981878.1 RDD family protein [Caulobacter sp. 17J80-11]